LMLTPSYRRTFEVPHIKVSAKRWLVPHAW
jgi:hypothetical protein